MSLFGTFGVEDRAFIPFLVITQPLVRQIDSMRVKSVASGVRM
jgi:hypothetical protein